MFLEYNFFGSIQKLPLAMWLLNVKSLHYQIPMLNKVLLQGYYPWTNSIFSPEFSILQCDYITITWLHASYYFWINNLLIIFTLGCFLYIIETCEIILIEFNEYRLGGVVN
jgi:hypothetical protein